MAIGPLKPAHRSMRISSVCAFALAFVVLASSLDICLASDGPDANLIFIFDASGSMAAKVQGRPKIDVAKEVISGLIRDLPAKTNVGLVVYGHRQKGDCTDVEELSPLAPVDKDALINRIRGIKPKGMTPITYSVQKVAEGLKNLKHESTIVLVSDGEETCKGDPCALVRELKASGIRFVMHVIGFDVNEKEKEQLSCIAKAGGGSYFTARNAGELSFAARKVVEKNIEQKPATLTVIARMNGKPFKAYCEIYKSEGSSASDIQKAAEGWTDNGSRTFQLNPGTYDLKVESRQTPNEQVVNFKAITVEPGKNVDKTADFSGGTLRVKALRNGTPSRASITIYKSGSNGEKITEGWTDVEAAVFKLAPDLYDAIVENREDANKPSITFQGIRVEPGKSIDRVAEFSGGALKMRALMNDKPLRTYCVVYKTQEEENEKEKVTEGWIELESTTFKLSPGPYDVVVESQDTNKSTVNFNAVRIEAGKTLEKVADFSGGTLRIKAQRNGRPLSAFCTVFQKNEGEGREKSVLTEIWTGSEGAALKLEAGDYDVNVENREDANGQSVTFNGTRVELGKTIEKVADFSGGTLNVKALRNGRPLSARCEVYQTDKDGEKKSIASEWTREDVAAFNLIPGTYDLVVENHDDAGSPSLSFPAILIEAGKTVEKFADFSGGTLKVKAFRNGKPISARCEVYQTGEDGEKKSTASEWTREDAAVFKLIPGAYDLVVENHDDAGNPSLSFPGIIVEAGKTVEKLADFSGGILKVKALRNGKLFSARCEVFQTGEDGEKKSITSEWTREDMASFKLIPGTYDLVVENHDDAGNPSLSFQGIAIEAGKIVDKLAEFSGGALKVKAFRNGKPFSARCEVYQTDEEGEKKSIASDWTREDVATFKLTPGTYDMVVENHDDAGSPSLSFQGIAIEAGKIVDKLAEFSGGTIKVKALRNGKSFSARCEVYQTGEDGEKKSIASEWTREDVAVFKLVPGVYDVIVEDGDSHEQKEFKGISLEAAKAQNLEARF